MVMPSDISSPTAANHPNSRPKRRVRGDLEADQQVTTHCGVGIVRRYYLQFAEGRVHLRNRFRLFLPCAFATIAFGCGREEGAPRETVQWIAAEQYLDARCWGGKDLAETPAKVPVRVFVVRRKDTAYVAFASRNCINNAYGLDRDEVPRWGQIENSIRPFRVVSWSEAAKNYLAQDLQVREVRTPPVHGLPIEPDTEVYDGSLEVLSSTLRDARSASDFRIGHLSDLRRRTELEPLVEPSEE